MLNLFSFDEKSPFVKPKQLSFLPSTTMEYGGNVRNGKRKIQRPFDPRRPLHVTLRSSKARGIRSLSHPDRKWEVHGLLVRISERHKVKLYRYANVGNHLHLLIQARKRSQLQAFLREFAGSVAVLVTGAIKGRPEKFWDQLVWSKIVDWGRQFRNITRYILLNIMEGSGLRNRKLLARLERDGIVLFQPEPG